MVRSVQVAWRLALEQERISREATEAFERSVERHKESAQRKGPSKFIMKAKCLTMQDWKRHLAGFNKIKRKAKEFMLKASVFPVTIVVGMKHLRQKS